MSSCDTGDRSDGFVVCHSRANRDNWLDKGGVLERAESESQVWLAPDQPCGFGWYLAPLSED